jgi:molybdenum cofactor guanylyltransferase
MGRPKAMVQVAGVPMAQRVADALAGGGCAPVVIIGDDGSGVDALGLRLVPDLWPGQGPLGGIITALRAVGGDVIVAACDLPGLDAATVTAVLEAGAHPPGGDDVPSGVEVAVAVDSRGHAALARWNIGVLSRLDDLFARGERSLGVALDVLGARRVPCDPAALRNVNRPSEL